MKIRIQYFLITALLICINQLKAQTTYTNFNDFEDAIVAAQPGDEIILASGRYEAESITLNAINGTAENPIIIRAEEIGADTLDDGTYFDFRNCSYITIQGFVINITEKFTTFKVQASNNITITQNIFNGEGEDYYKDDGVSRNSSVWISLQGKWDDHETMSHHNTISHNLFMNKHTLGNMIRIDGTNELYVSQYDVIEHNHFKNMGPRADNEMEVIRVGWSAMSESDGYCSISNNLFEECNGDPEIVSVKCNKNDISHNTFRRCEGTLSLRHGNGSVVDGNFFFGEGADGTGGIRLYGSDHVIINNYFEGLTGTKWDAPITLTEGDAEEGSSGLSNHFRIERALIANNTLVNNTYGIEIGYDNNGKYSKPARDVVMAYNVLSGSSNSLVKYINDPDNMTWVGNIAYLSGDAVLGENVTFTSDQIDIQYPKFELNTDFNYYKATGESPTYTPTAEIAAEVLNDMDGQLRSAVTNYGADEFNTSTVVYVPLTAADVGPSLGEYLYASISEVSFLVSGGEKEVNVYSNLNWQVNEDVEWMEIASATGSGHGSFTLKASENTTGLIRTGIITVTSTNAEDGNEVTQNIVVSQQDVEPSVLSVSSKTLSFNASASDNDIQITSNVDWTVTA